ncbi:MAG: hypothetical protein ACRD4Y_01110 [Candidatus Acidiferrales bacterium]
MRSFAQFGGFGLVVACLLLTARPAHAQSSEPAPSRKQAIEDLKEIAYAGNVNAQVQLGVIYLTGDGVPKDDAEAVKWLRKAADQDSPLAERYLAEMYFKGRGVPADNEEAAKWLLMAADQDDAQSEYNLAVLYTKGMGVPRNFAEALKWMRRAASQNLAEGQTGMGAAYENGDGVSPDPVAAAKWYQKAVDQDYVPAMNNLALLMATSTNHAIRDPKQAVALATKAVSRSLNPEYLDTLAAAYFADGQTGKAVETEQKALTRDPENDSYKQSLEKYLSAAHTAQ